MQAKWFFRSIGLALSFVLLAGVLSLVSPEVVGAASDSLEIAGDGVKNPMTFTLKELQAMEQDQYVYSCINTWPTKKWYVGKGVKLRTLLDKAGMTDDATLIRFSSTDGYMATLTVKELFEDKRYRFPNFKSGGDSDGHIPGDPAGKVEVEPIVALVSVEGSDKPEYMNDLNSLLLMLGQRTVIEQTGNLFVKYLTKIEVLTVQPEKWDAPQANPGSGVVPPGTMVTLSNTNSDDDKIYYTTDGSIPTMDSPMYNWIASRWWSARADVLGTVNHPIGPITKDTTIKAITIGPGKLDSDVVTFDYQVEQKEETTGKQSMVVKLSIGLLEASIDGRPYTLDAAPYINAESERTLVPVRFVSEALGACVAWDQETRKVTITYGEKEIILTVGSDSVLVNGSREYIDCVPELLPPGRIFVPLRFVGETLGAEVIYDSGEILITRKQ
ncbi:MAG: stalk domain-containing protein [Syntrophomonadaceae bacterium]